jgi:hypothetical protein
LRRAAPAVIAPATAKTLPEQSAVVDQSIASDGVERGRAPLGV